MHDSVFKLWDKAIIRAGRLKGEKVTVIGSTDLNMDHRVIVRREHRRRRRNLIMGFHTYDLQKCKGLRHGTTTK
jgi:hypothetical protein